MFTFAQFGYPLELMPPLRRVLKVSIPTPRNFQACDLMGPNFCLSRAPAGEFSSSLLVFEAFH